MRTIERVCDILPVKWTVLVETRSGHYQYETFHIQDLVQMQVSDDQVKQDIGGKR